MEQDLIKSLVAAFDKRANKNVSLIINIQGESTPKETGSILTEFYDLDEADQIISGMKNAGITVNLFTSEIDYLKHSIDKTNNDLIVFNMGRNGVGLTKKSLIPMICSARGLRYTGSDAYVTALCRNKFHYTLLLECIGVSVPKTDAYFRGRKYGTSGRLGADDLIIIKPAYEAASRGVYSDSIIQYGDSQKIASTIMTLSKEFCDSPVLVQQFIEGFEIEVPVFVVNKRATAIMPVGLSVNNAHYIGDKILDYERSALYDYDFYDYREENRELAKEITRCAEEVASLLGLRGYGRVDFRVDINGKFYVIDISTHPFIMKHSSFTFAFNKMGIEYSNLFKCIIECSLDNYQ